MGWRDVSGWAPWAELGCGGGDGWRGLGDDPGAVRVLGLPKQASRFSSKAWDQQSWAASPLQGRLLLGSTSRSHSLLPSSAGLVSPPPSVPEPRRWAPSRRQDFNKYSQVLTENQVGTTTSFTQF